MAKLGDFKTPTGASGNILNPMDWLAFIVGAMVLIITFAMGQNFASRLGAKIPGVDTQIEPITTSRIIMESPTNTKARTVL